MRLSKTIIDRVSIDAQKNSEQKFPLFLRDSALPGFGVRISRGGTKSFILETRIRGKVKRITLGRYGILTVEEARSMALQKLNAIAHGRDPVAEQKAPIASSITLEKAFADYLLIRKDLKATSVYDYQRCIEGDLKDWLKRPLNEITKDMVELRHRQLGERSHARANNTMRVLRAIYNFAKGRYEDTAGRPMIPMNPIDRLSHTRAWFPNKRKETLLRPHQLKPWYEATLLLNNTISRDYLHLVLYTGLRRTEAASIRWEDVDFESGILTIREPKNGQTHILPITPTILRMLKIRESERVNEYVFPGPKDIGYQADTRGSVRRVTELSGIKFTLHDLRRTFITIAESLDIPGYALKRLLNHKNPNDVTAGYIVPNAERLREPMERISDFMDTAIAGTDTPLSLSVPSIESQNNRELHILSNV